MCLAYRNQSIGLHCKSMDRVLYDRDLRHERVTVKHLHTHYDIPKNIDKLFRMV